MLAVNEIITPVQLLQEIEPLLKEYFIGNFEIKGNALNLKFKNGQNFILKIAEIIKNESWRFFDEYKAKYVGIIPETKCISILW